MKKHLSPMVMALALVFSAGLSMPGGGQAAQPSSPASGSAETRGQLAPGQRSDDAHSCSGRHPETDNQPDVYVAGYGSGNIWVAYEPIAKPMVSQFNEVDKLRWNKAWRDLGAHPPNGPLWVGMEGAAENMGFYNSFFERKSVAKVWKNGKEHFWHMDSGYRINGEEHYWHMDGEYRYVALSLFVCDDDVYVGDWNGIVSKNGKAICNNLGGFVTSVFVAGENVYCLVNDAKVYKNGTAHYSHLDLVQASSSNAQVIKVKDGRTDFLRPYTTRQAIFYDVEIETNTTYYPYGAFETTSSYFWPNPPELHRSGYNLTILYDKGFSPNASLAVSDGDAYVAGSYRDKALDKRMAKVWKNGEELHCLTDGQLNAYASSIAVSGGDVYVAGTVFDTQKTSAAKVWKNGEELYSFASELKGRAYGDCIFVTGTDVYVAGTDFDKSSRKKIAKAWKNGEEIFSLKDSIINSLYVFGEDVYVAGCRQKGGGTKTAKAWKNGKELYTLTDGKDNADAYAIFVK